jgi:serine protease inhibitor
MQTSLHGSTPPSKCESRWRRDHDRFASWVFAVSLALLACEGTERPLDARPPSFSEPPPSRGEQAEHDDFHALLVEPTSGHAVGEVPADLLTAAVERSNAASFEVWRALEERENFVVSPYSIRSALGLLYLAASQESRRRSLQSRLRYPERNEDMDIRLLHGVVQGAGEAGFGSANALWVARQHVLSRAYLEAVSRSLPAEVHSIDFAADPKRAERMIDAWASDRTSRKIPSILEEGSIHELTRSVLVDTVYLRWDSPLNPGITPSSFPRSFSTSRGTKVKADMMICSPCFAVFRNDYQAAIANYRGSASLVFVAVMPKRWKKFRWNATAFRRVWASLAQSRVADLELPTLRLRSRENLGAVMTKLDLDVVDTRLQQGLLASGEPVTLGALVHEASIQVDQTTVLFEPLPKLSRELLGERSSLRVDRPFYFVLVERRTGLVLLMGQVTDPTA